MIASSFTLGTIQIDGRRYVTERHVDDFSRVYNFEYLASSGANYTAVMSARSVQLASDLVIQELASDLSSVLTYGDSATVTRSYCTVNQLTTMARAFYRDATKENAVAMGAYLSTLTDNQLQNAFSLTASQTALLRTKVTSAVAIWHSIQSEAGQ